MSKHAERAPAGLAEQLGCYSPLVREPLSGEQAGELSRVFKAMGDPVRLRLLSLIASHAGGEACVCDLTEVFDLSGPTISHHLKVLREAGLITGERRATWIYYRIRPEVLEVLAAVLVPAAPDTVPNELEDVVPQARRELPVVEA
jgi:ArsR family transcriptional regulator, arsenate/arsenite/antimonite-responsive transcriptional repressor